MYKLTPLLLASSAGGKGRRGDVCGLQLTHGVDPHHRTQEALTHGHCLLVGT